MFIYAAGLALAERLGADLVCDIGHYHRRRARQDRPFGLDAFGFAWTRGAVPPYARWRDLAVRMRLLADPFRDAARLHSSEGYDPRFEQIAGSCALTGYFQSWRYLAGHEPSVRRAFDVTKPASGRTAALAAEIARCACPVAVHVRRGDYVSTPARIDKFGMLRRDYYDAGRGALEPAMGGVRPTFFLFSDDMEAAVGELDGWGELRPVAGFALEDLYLMTRCRHFIIANSTFSWWAAWLAEAAGKQVVAPARWFGPAFDVPYAAEDRLVPGWLAV